VRHGVSLRMRPRHTFMVDASPVLLEPVAKEGIDGCLSRKIFLLFLTRDASWCLTDGCRNTAGALIPRRQSAYPGRRDIQRQPAALIASSAGNSILTELMRSIGYSLCSLETTKADRCLLVPVTRLHQRAHE
jgi:hypothetical protein